jgi:hypothetical protein
MVFSHTLPGGVVGTGVWKIVPLPIVELENGSDRFLETIVNVVSN